MKLGIIGCGIITQEAHLPALLRLKEEIQVVALCNHSLPKAEKTAALLGEELPLYTDWQEMIQEVQEMDAVLVSLPILLNYPVSKKCIEAGLNVICEKPAGINVEEAALTLELNKEGGPLFMTAENYQYDSAVLKAEELIKEGIIGTVHSMQWNAMNHMPEDNKFNQTQWRSKNQYQGGYVLDGGVHYAHALQMLAGPIVTVYGKTGSINPLMGTMDMGFALLTHASGVVSSLNMGWQHRTEEEFLKIFGTKGTLILKEKEILCLTPEGNTREYAFEEEDSFYSEWVDFHRAVSSGSAPKLQQDLAVRDVKVIGALIHSQKEERQVSL